MNIKQANILNDTTVRGSIRFGASRFIGTQIALGPNKMFVASKKYSIDEAQLPGESHRAFNGGYIVDFGESWDGVIPSFGAGIIDTLILPINTKKIVTAAFAGSTAEDSPISLLILPKGVEIIENTAFAGGFFVSIIFEGEEITINTEAFAGIQVQNIEFKQKKGAIEIGEGAFGGLMPFMKKGVNVYLPDAPEEGPLSIKIVDGGMAEAVDATIYVPANYNETNPNTSLAAQAFFGSGNVVYNGNDTHAPWGANKLNGEEVNG